MDNECLYDAINDTSAREQYALYVAYEECKQRLNALKNQRRALMELIDELEEVQELILTSDYMTMPNNIELIELVETFDTISADSRKALKLALTEAHKKRLAALEKGE
jgi:hypothetical protein